jgi:hypothetical protein
VTMCPWLHAPRTPPLPQHTPWIIINTMKSLDATSPACMLRHPANSRGPAAAHTCKRRHQGPLTCCTLTYAAAK